MNHWFNSRHEREADRSHRARRNQPVRLEILEDRQLLAVNAIVLENQLPGNPASEWDIVGAGDDNIEGFATDISVDQGQTVQFKINTDSTNYRLDIYRMGYYGGMGARKVATVQPSLVPFEQPEPLTDQTSRLVDAGNWSVTASWAVPSNATSGIYFAKLVREDGEQGSSHIVFVVRDDDGESEVLFQTSDTTWQAYNTWGGKSLYDLTSENGQRAYKVSYNRPFETRATPGGMGATNWVFWAEYPMVRWMERNGYDVSYSTDVDSDRRGTEILEHEAFLSVGHDEYWSGAQRANVEAARDSGVHLAFFSGNEVYWKTRWETSIDNSGTPYRTLVTYKESPTNRLDPMPGVWTGQWADRSFAAVSDGGIPQNGLTGQLFTVNRGPGGDFGTSIQVPGDYADMRFWRDTTIANLGPNDVAFLANGTLGYEWDEDVDNGFRPAGQFRMSSTTEFVPEKILQTTGGCVFGGTGLCGSCGCGPVEPGWATHSLVMYRTPAGSIVFGAGTVQWSFGLDGVHDGPATVEDARMQQATVNLFADMGIQPGTLQANLVAATESTDLTAPSITFVSPSSNVQIQSDTDELTITGTAVDVGGGVVAGVEISVDGGNRWHPAVGRGDWSYTWRPEGEGTYQVLVRAADDSGNLSAATGGVAITILPDETTAPSISNVNAIGINEQSIEIRWTTDEPSTSEVHYGLTPTSLNTVVNSSQMTLNHSLILTGLIPNTTYFYRVVSVDEFGNATTSPATSTAPGTFSTLAFIDSTIADFGAGTINGLTDFDIGGGALILQPAASADFAGSSLPSGWSGTAWQPGGGVSTSLGKANVDGGMLATTSLFGAQRTLEFAATFSEQTLQHAGFANDFSQQLWGMFSTKEGGALYARTNNGVQSIDTLIPGVALGVSHNFRITVGATSVTYWVDDVQVAQHAVTLSSAMRPVASDYNPGGGVLAIDWMRLGNYATSGTFESRVFDALNPVHWNLLQYGASTPTGTSIAVSVRMGNTPTPDANWTSFIPLASSGSVVGGVSRYIQYRAVLSTSDPAVTPVLESVSLSHTPAASDATAPTISSRSPGSGAIDVSPTSTIDVVFSELMSAASVTTATVQLRPAGGGAALPATVTLGGSTAHLTPTTALSPNTSYEVFVSGSVSDLAGNSLGANSTWSFTSGWQTIGDTTAADFSSGTTYTGAYIAETMNGELSLGPGAGAEFNGAALPSGWNSSAWQGGGAASVANGLLQVNGAIASQSALFSPGRSLEFVATFGGDAYQSAGWAVDLMAAPWAIFSTGAGGALYARTSGGGDTSLGAGWLGAPHHFQIDWNAGGFTYSIDGTQVATHALPISQGMRAVASDYLVGGQALTVDWTRTGPYAATGAFESRILDPGQEVYWDAAIWDDYVPSGADVDISVRLGNSLTPDSNWTDFIPLATSGGLIGANARYAQYRVDLSHAGVTEFEDSPLLRSINLRYSSVVPDTTPPAILSVTPAPSATSVAGGATVQVSFSELIDPASVGAGEVVLLDTISGQMVPATVTVTGSKILLDPTDSLGAHRVYQVTLSTDIADFDGNTLSAQYSWSFTSDYLRIGDTSAADFTLGTNSGTAVGSVSGGALTLAGVANGDFTGPSLPSGWAQSAWNSGGGVQLSQGANVEGAFLRANSYVGPSRSLEFEAAFTGAAYQHAGFADDFNTSLWAMFSTGAGGALYARTSSFGDTLLPGNLLGSSHRFRIQWESDRVEYYVDDVLAATHATVLTPVMRPVVSDYIVDGNAINVKWMRLSPFNASGTFTSRVFDAGQLSAWNSAAWNTRTPAGTSVALSARWGNTPTPDASWTSFAPLTTSGASLGVTSRYFQYQATLNTSNTQRTPELLDFSLEYGAVTDTIAPTIVSRTPAVGATGVGLTSAVTIVFSEPVNASTVTSLSVDLRVAGGSSVAATLSAVGNTVTITPTSPLAGNTAFEVAVSGSIADLAGNPMGSPVLWTFTTGTASFADTSSADFGSGSTTGAEVTGNGGGAVQLQLSGGVSDAFDGTTLGSGWTTSSWAPFGGGPTSVQVSGGLLSLAGAQLLSTSTGASAPLNARLAFAASPYQHFGFATDLSAVAGNYWAIFSTGGTSDRLLARTNVSGSTQDVDLGALPSGLHDYRIAPVSGGFEFYVDNVLRAMLNATMPTSSLRIAASVFLGSAMQIDQVQMAAYPSSGEFLSRIFDATRVAGWNVAEWNATLASGTSVTIQTRSGNVAAPDGTWSSWQGVANGGAIASPSARYIQYRAVLSTSDPLVTPILLDLSIRWT